MICLSSTSSTWNHEADVVIVGYGGAGACAAIEAHDAGAKVVILEKMPQTYEGGNTRVSMGGIVFPTNLADGIEYVRALSFGTVKEEELFRTYVAGALEIPHWVERLGGRLTFAKAAPTFPSLPGSKSITTSHRMEGGGPALFQFLSNHVKSRKIEILYETRAKELIQDPKTRKIRGVKAEGSSKEEIVIKARRAVILACGGYQNDTEMHSCFHFPGLRIYPAGTPSNTGDGIKMALKAGAELWHNASFEWYEVSIKPLQNNDCAIPMNIPVFRSPSYIFVNRYGKRFRDESRSWIHRKDPSLRHTSTTKLRNTRTCRATLSSTRT